MNKICTSIEQSKKLIELGIDVNTADFMWEYNPDKETYWNKPTIIPIDDYIFVNDIPAWSLSALLSILPLHIIVNGKVYKFGMSKGFNKNGETYAIKYSIFNTTFYYHMTDFYNSPIDAAFEMISWLKENGKI